MSAEPDERTVPLENERLVAWAQQVLESGPGAVKVAIGQEQMLENWLIASYGAGELPDGTVEEIYVTTDHVHASEDGGDALAEAQAHVLMRKTYVRLVNELLHLRYLAAQVVFTGDGKAEAELAGRAGVLDARFWEQYASKIGRR